MIGVSFKTMRRQARVAGNKTPGRRYFNPAGKRVFLRKQMKCNLSNQIIAD
jgi:hypothetical protein